MSLNFIHSRFPCCQTQSEPLDFEDPPCTYRKLYACQILLKHRKKKVLTVRVTELTTFQCSKILDVDDNTCPIISCYRDFSLERHETYPHSSELMFESMQMKLCHFFFLDISLLTFPITQVNL
jgi:hypothetical protein